MASESIARDIARLCNDWPLGRLPDRRPRGDHLPHAPVRKPALTDAEKKLALSNALRYIPPQFHETLGPEFAEELDTYGHIYMYRLIPDFTLRAYPIGVYPAKCLQAAAIMCMIMNNVDHQVAQYPQELVTYGGNGQVFSNWAQFRLTMHYLSEMTTGQTLVIYSGHPLGLFPSHPDAPRVVITNGMVIPNYSSREMYERLFALGVTMYGQMTAGSYCYIGPQGIVHGTTLTILNAGRKYLGLEDLSGKVLVTSGLGGMSGAQAKAAVICGCIAVIAEISEEALEKRFQQGWLMEKVSELDELVARIRSARKERRPVSIGYHGNVVDVWEKLAKDFEETEERLVDLGTDQTSCHNPYMGGYYPVQLTYEDSRKMMHTNPEEFQRLVKESLRRQVKAINRLAGASGMFFWDYGNAFLLEAGRADAAVFRENSSTEYCYPSYVQHIMGDIFSLGFGPFRWVCTSGEPSDLVKTDQIAADVMKSVLTRGVTPPVEQQYNDNLRWIKEADKHKLVVGSQARILYSDQKGRIQLAVAFNEAVANGKLQGPVVISRDHHDVSGTDSPFRETSNIYDGSSFCADMAVQNVIGDSFRGATWVSLHNGGGVGWGEVINGGFGLVLDGSAEAERRARQMLTWDVSNGVARRSWSGNDKANETIREAMKEDNQLRVTLPYPVTWSN